MPEQNTLDDLFARHDSDPQAVGAALRAFPGVPEKDLIRFTWLVSHVVGEIQATWPDALGIMRRLVPGDAPVPALINFAACAYLAGAAVKGMALERQIAEALSCDQVHAKYLVQLAVLQYAGKAAEPNDLVSAFSGCLEHFRSASVPEKITRICASSLNNVTSLLLDHEAVDHQADPVRSLLLEGSERTRDLWRKAGNWINHERADYLVALCANRTGNWEIAKSAALSGLATIESNGPEDVDRAFILLELARAERELGHIDQYMTARAQAAELAAAFDENLRNWFNSRAVGL